MSETPTAVRRWSMLLVSMLGQAASSAAVNGPAFLIPALHGQGMSLSRAGLVAAASTAGSMCTLILWGALADAWGEVRTLTSSLGLTAVALAAAAMLHHHLTLLAAFLFLAGTACAGTASASGRVVVGWFPPHRRGLAMGIRQMAQPVGLGAAALFIPVLAHDHGVGAALLAPLTMSALAAAACALVVLDPPRPEKSVEATANPYRDDTFLPRIHSVSILLVVPQFTVWTFMLVWLQVDRHWAPAAAGTLVALTQLLGAAGRIGAGALSDAVGSRMRPLRWVSIAATASMAALGLTTMAGWSVAVLLMVVASVVTVADNGLAFTAVAERAGPVWSGRALGLQNTGQYVAAALVPPVLGALIPVLGYGGSFLLVAAFPLVATPLVPTRDARSHQHTA